MVTLKPLNKFKKSSTSSSRRFQSCLLLQENICKHLKAEAKRTNLLPLCYAKGKLIKNAVHNVWFTSIYFNKVHVFVMSITDERERDHKSELCRGAPTPPPRSFSRTLGICNRSDAALINVLLTALRQTSRAAVAEMQTVSESLWKRISFILPRNVETHCALLRVENTAHASFKLHSKRLPVVLVQSKCLQHTY